MPDGITVKVNVNIDSLRKYAHLLSENSPITVGILRKWIYLYREFLYVRFLKMSAGGWKRLSKRTRKKFASHSLVLRDSDTLLNALTPSDLLGSARPGAFAKISGLTAIVGYGGGAWHPTREQLTVAALAEMHNIGAGNLPLRRIIVAPRGETRRKIETALVKEANKLKRKLGL